MDDYRASVDSSASWELTLAEGDDKRTCLPSDEMTLAHKHTHLREPTYNRGEETIEPILPNVGVSAIYNPPSNLTLNVDGPPASFDIDIGSAASETAFHHIGLLAQHDIKDDFEIMQRAFRRVNDMTITADWRGYEVERRRSKIFTRTEL